MPNESNPRLTIVIVSYNTKDLLLQCLSSIFEQTVETDFEVIVVDNNSMDNSPEEVKARFPLVKLIANEDNVGFAKANNQALRLMKGEYALLLNPDTVVLDNALDEMVRHMESQRDTGVLGCRILSSHGSLQRAAYPPPSLWISLISMLNLERLAPGRADRYYSRHLERFFPPHLTNRYYDEKYRTLQKPFRVGWVSGACLLIRKSTMKDIGLLDENLFLFGEDTDWCCRARQRKWRVMILPQARIIHYGGMSISGSLSVGIGSGQYSRLYFAKKHFGSMAVFILKCVSLAALMVKYAIIKLKPGMNRQERESRLRGYRHGFRIILTKIR
jgi:GT2 family glycosyltransferase